MEPKHFALDYEQTVRFYAHALQHAADNGGLDAIKALKKRLGSQDLFFLMVFILKRRDIMRKWLFERCREFQRAPDNHLDLWAREHYKSTIITFGGTIFEFINNPEVTAAIFSHTKGIARVFLAQIKQEIEQNPELHELWPDIFWEDPVRDAPQWSIERGIVLKRQGNPKEATLEAHGLVDGQPTSRHFSLRIYDDVVTLESVSTPDQIQKTTAAWQMSDNLGAEGGRVRYIGTRYHLFDTYRTMLDADVVIPRIHPATKDGTDTGDPVLMDKASLMHKRKVQGPYVFSSQMLLDPTADKAMGFNLKWLRYGDVEYGMAMRSLWRIILVDPAGSKKRKNNDYTTMWVLGHGEDGQYRVLDIRRDRMNLTKRAETLMELHRRWKPGIVAYEEYGMQADIEAIKIIQAADLYEFPIHPVGGSMKKEWRILRLVSHFENGWKEGDGEGKSKIILPTTCVQIDYQGQAVDLVKVFVEQEYTAFPVLAHDDMLDALARLCDLEEQGLIQKPNIVAIPEKGVGLGDGLRNSKSRQSLGEDSWVTA